MTAKQKQSEIEFRVATPEDALDAVNFHNSHYHEKRRPEHWLWEYQTYEPDKTVFIIARQGDRVVATEAQMPIYMDVGGKYLLSTKGENYLCSPAYRGTGLVQNMRKVLNKEISARGINFRWNFLTVDALPGRNKFTTIYRGIQVWERPGNTRVAIVSKLRGNEPLWRRTGSVAKLVLKVFLMRKTASVPDIEKKAGYQVSKERIHHKQLKELHDRVKSERKNIISIKYDRKFLEWRVYNNPFLKYDEYQVCQGGKLRAYAFVALFQGEASISDLLSEDKHATYLLLSAIIENYQKRAGNFWFIVNPTDYLYEGLLDQLREFGFKFTKRWILVVSDQVGGKNREFYEIRNWHVTGLWTEGFLH